jgi:hypothetical protein
MSKREAGKKPAGQEGEAFLERWSRLKAEARVDHETEPAQHESPVPADPESPAEAGAHEAAPAGPIEQELPDLEDLDEDADYSAFLTPRVEQTLRRKALRKLFHSPKFNVCDGLDDYCEDFTQFEKLGDIVTFDMRHRLENAAQKVAASLQDDGDQSAPVAGDSREKRSTGAAGDDKPDSSGPVSNDASTEET